MTSKTDQLKHKAIRLKWYDWLYIFFHRLTGCKACNYAWVNWE